MRFFIAHSKAEGEDPDAYAAILTRARKIVGDEHELVSGRNDFLANMESEGGWDGWSRSIATRVDPETGVRVYDGVLVPSNRVGKATAAIVGACLEAGVEVYCFSGEIPERWGTGVTFTNDAWPVGAVELVDRKDFKTGWALIPF